MNKKALEKAQIIKEFASRLNKIYWSGNLLVNTLTNGWKRFQNFIHNQRLGYKQEEEITQWLSEGDIQISYGDLWLWTTWI